MQHTNYATLSNSSFDKITRTRSNEKAKSYKEQERNKEQKRKSTKGFDKRKSWE